MIAKIVNIIILFFIAKCISIPQKHALINNVNILFENLVAAAADIILMKSGFPKLYKNIVIIIPIQLKNNIESKKFHYFISEKKPILPVYKFNCILIIVKSPKLNNKAPNAGI